MQKRPEYFILPARFRDPLLFLQLKVKLGPIRFLTFRRRSTLFREKLKHPGNLSAFYLQTRSIQRKLPPSWIFVFEQVILINVLEKYNQSGFTYSRFSSS